MFGNFYLGEGAHVRGAGRQWRRPATDKALKRSPKVFNPRAGVAWDVAGDGKWVVRGGAGIYSNWLTQANVQEEFRGNPPGSSCRPSSPEPSTPPIFVQGTSDDAAVRIPVPAAGGIAAVSRRRPVSTRRAASRARNSPIGGINPELKSPTAYIFDGRRRAAARPLGSRAASSTAALIRPMRWATAIRPASSATASTSTPKPGDLLNKPPGSPPTRLNSSFGPINYADNDRVANYNGITFDLRGRAKGLFFDASYTRSSSKDDRGLYPTAINPHQFYGPSPWDVPHRVSLTANYLLPDGQTLKALTSGWGVSTISIYQSGYPMTVFTNAPFTAGGDYNADGDNFDYPNVTDYSMGHSPDDYLTSGVFHPGQFTAPAPGTNGNEQTGQFRQPDFAQTDIDVYKNTRIFKDVDVQLRLEFYNIFNRKNLYLENNLSSGGFGKAISQQLPRWWQFGARLTF